MEGTPKDNDADLTEQMQEIYNIQKNNYLSIDHEQLVEWIFVCKQDYYAGKVLYENKLYPPAVFHFQQCTEKLVKLYALLLRYANEKEVRGASHDPLKVYKLLLAKEPVKRLFQMVDEVEQHSKLLQMSTSAFHPTYEEIVRFINSINDAINQLDAVPPEASEISRELMGNIARLLVEKEDLPASKKQAIVDSVRLNSLTLQMLNFCFRNLLDFALIFANHEQSTRYPIQGGCSPHKYTSEMELVRVIPDIYPFIERSISSAEAMVNKIAPSKSGAQDSIGKS